MTALANELIWMIVAGYIGWLVRDVYGVWLDERRKTEQLRRDLEDRA